jgi:hypothetical protein
MDTSHVNISELERGVTQLTLGYMRGFAAVFGVKAGDLLSVEDRGTDLSPDEDRLIHRFRMGNEQQRGQLLGISQILIPVI